MKSAISVIALLLVSSTQAIKFFDIPTEENTQVIAQARKMNSDDMNIMNTVDLKLDQAKRNAEQGELGRTLAMSKVSEIKMSLAQVKENFVKETQHAVSDGIAVPEDEMDMVVAPGGLDPMYDLKKKQDNLRELEKKKN